MTKSRTESTVDLMELFRDIDVNGDGTVEWSELLAFTIEAGVVATRKEVLPVFFKFSNTGYLDTSSRGAILHVRPVMRPPCLLNERPCVAISSLVCAVALSARAF